MEKELSYKDMESPVGKIRLVATEKGLAAILWEGEDLKRTKLENLMLNEKHSILVETEKQLRDYFHHDRKSFELPMDWEGTPFQKSVWNALLAIPFGETKTYGQLSEILGDKNAVRAVGGALNKNPIAIIVPCHRIVGAAGKLVGFAGGFKNKSILLELERQHIPDLFNS